MRHENRRMNRSSKILPVTLVTGFLGSGKTTLLRKLLPQQGLGFRLGAVVNDFAELNVDADIVRRIGVPSSQVVELTNGCICCNLAADLKQAVWRMLQSAEGSGSGSATPADVEYLLVETSGITDPMSIIATLEEAFGKMTRVRLESVVTVVDIDKLLADKRAGQWHALID